VAQLFSLGGFAHTQFTNIMNDSSRKLEPWVVVDPHFKREWVLPQALQYYVVEDRDKGTWFICDRWADIPVPGTESPTRGETIRRFYKWCGREIPEGTTLGHAPAGVAHHGETG
jgi:hypothetical protein